MCNVLHAVSGVGCVQIVAGHAVPGTPADCQAAVPGLGASCHLPCCWLVLKLHAWPLIVPTQGAGAIARLQAGPHTPADGGESHCGIMSRYAVLAARYCQLRSLPCPVPCALPAVLSAAVPKRCVQQRPAFALPLHAGGRWVLQDPAAA